MKLYSLKKAVVYASKKNDLKWEEKDILRITKDFATAGFSQAITKNDFIPIEKAVIKICSIQKRTNPLKTTASIHSECPLCGVNASSMHSSMVDVLLADKRPAKLCVEHSVTIPCIIEN